MDDRTRKAIRLLHEGLVEARKLHETQTQHLDNLVAVADALEELAQQQDKTLRSVAPLPSPRKCVGCGERLTWDGGWSHLDGNRVYGHVADPGEEYRERQRKLMADIRARNAAG